MACLRRPHVAILAAIAACTSAAEYKIGGYVQDRYQTPFLKWVEWTNHNQQKIGGHAVSVSLTTYIDATATPQEGVKEITTTGSAQYVDALVCPYGLVAVSTCVQNVNKNYVGPVLYFDGAADSYKISHVERDKAEAEDPALTKLVEALEMLSAHSFYGNLGWDDEGRMRKPKYAQHGQGDEKRMAVPTDSRSHPSDNAPVWSRRLVQDATNATITSTNTTTTTSTTTTSTTTITTTTNNGTFTTTEGTTTNVTSTTATTTTSTTTVQTHCFTDLQPEICFSTGDKVSWRMDDPNVLPKGTIGLVSGFWDGTEAKKTTESGGFIWVQVIWPKGNWKMDPKNLVKEDPLSVVSGAARSISAASLVAAVLVPFVWDFSASLTKLA